MSAILRAVSHARWLSLVGWLALGGGCGRFDFDARGAPPVDASIDAAVDASIGAAGCPTATTPIAPGSKVCIELAQRGVATWTNARAACMALGRRLCQDAEWFEACTMASGLTGMVGDDYEWVAEESGGVAQKRGAGGCDDMSAHEIFMDPYGYRCCVGP